MTILPEWSRQAVTPAENDTIGFITPNEPLLNLALMSGRDTAPGSFLGIGGVRCFNFASTDVSSKTVDGRQVEYHFMDRYPPVAATALMLLEAGLMLRRSQGQITTRTYVDTILSQNYWDGIIEHIGRKFGHMAQLQLRKGLDYRLNTPDHEPDTTDIGAYLRHYQYIHPSNHQGWLSNDTNLNRLIDRYEDGQIHIHVADITDEQYMARFASDLSLRAIKFGLVDLSNIDCYMLDSARNNLTKVFGMGGKYTDNPILPLEESANIHVSVFLYKGLNELVIYNSLDQNNPRFPYTCIKDFSHHLVGIDLIRQTVAATGRNPIFHNNAFLSLTDRKYGHADQQTEVVYNPGVYRHTLPELPSQPSNKKKQGVLGRFQKFIER